MEVDCDAVNDSWGPWAGSCRGSLDFTLLFEESVLCILPAALLLLSLPIYVLWLRGKNKNAKKGILLLVKQALIIMLGLLKLTILMLWALSDLGRTKATLAASAINFLAVFPLAIISYFEHVFKVSPSILVESYLLLTLGFDVVRIRTLWLLPAATKVAAPECAALFIKLALMIAESQPKRSLLLRAQEQYTGEQLSGLYGRALFLWLWNTLWSGFHRFLDSSDLSGLRDDDSSELQRVRFRRNWNARPNKHTKMALMATLFKSMPDRFLIPAIPRAIIIAITLAQPLLLERMLNFVQGGGYAQRLDIGYALIGAFALLYCLTAVFNAWFHHASNRLSLELRSQLIDVIYRHLLRLRPAALDTGKATTLINVDMQHIVDGSLILHDVWASIVTVGVAVYLLYLQIQLAFIAPLLCTLVMTFLGGMFGQALGDRQVAWLASTESRVKSTMAMISSFKEVKMLGLSQDYFQGLQKLRVNEVQLGKRFRRIISIIIALSAASTELSILVAYGGFAIISKIHNIPLTPQTIFSSLALLRISLDPLFLLIQGTPALVSMFKCLGRIQDLLNDERQYGADSERLDMSSTTSVSSLSQIKPGSGDSGATFYPLFLSGLSQPSLTRPVSPAYLIEVSDATFCWKEKEAPSLYIMALSIQPYSFTAIIGPVGCGKSTLLKALLGEVEQISGNRRTQAGLRMAYCDQEPWLLDQTIRENIVGALSYDPVWYNTVVDACSLTQDLSDMPKGDGTSVGTKGSALSGGQRSRVALARAIYSRPHLILLDDVFSGLDRKSAQHIFMGLFSETGLLVKLRCAVVLVTHSTQLLPRFDHILALKNGIITHQGTYQDLLIQGVLDDEALSDPDQAFAGGDSNNPSSLDVASKKPDEKDVEEANNRAPSDFSVYAYFLQSCGSLGMALFFVLAAVLAAERSFENVWLKMWAESNDHSLTYYITIFTGLIVGGLTLLYGLCFFFFDILLSSSSLKLYLRQLDTLMRSSVSYVVSVGSTTIANRFIQDIMLIDDELPMALVNTTTALFGACAESIIIFVSSKYISVSIPVLIGVLFMIQKFYLRTSKQLRLMDIEAKAPLSAFVLETIQGVVSIRAFGRMAEFSSRNTRHLDDSQRAMYMLLSVQVWLKMVLDFVVAALAILVTSLAVNLRSSQSLGFLGLALVNLISLSSSFKYLITFWAQLETSIGAVARIKRFNSDVEPEETAALPSAHANWPGRGEIEFQHMSATYSPKIPPALYNLSLHIMPGTKVAVCGRSGSGKSSFLSTILRCLDLTSGSVIIDGQDITRISKDSLRKRIMTLPQKSLFIHDSIRRNMTLWDEDSSLSLEEIDAQIETVLRRVGIWDALFSKALSGQEPSPSGPEPDAAAEEKRSKKKNKKTKKQDGGDVDGKKKQPEVVTLDSLLEPEERLSVGQQQLFCLARGLFQRAQSQIVLMDEFTSSMDHETEMLVRQIVKQDFRSKTVIEVIHRLEHILDFDLVIVMEKGRAVEAGHPGQLLGKEGGVLRELYRSSRG